jgi:hypothetical protein
VVRDAPLLAPCRRPIFNTTKPKGFRRRYASSNESIRTVLANHKTSLNSVLACYKT